MYYESTEYWSGCMPLPCIFMYFIVGTRSFIVQTIFRMKYCRLTIYTLHLSEILNQDSHEMSHLISNAYSLMGSMLNIVCYSIPKIRPYLMWLVIVCDWDVLMLSNFVFLSFMIKIFLAILIGWLYMGAQLGDPTSVFSVFCFSHIFF